MINNSFQNNNNNAHIERNSLFVFAIRISFFPIVQNKVFDKYSISAGTKNSLYVLILNCVLVSLRWLEIKEDNLFSVVFICFWYNNKQIIGMFTGLIKYFGCRGAVIK